MIRKEIIIVEKITGEGQKGGVKVIGDGVGMKRKYWGKK